MNYTTETSSGAIIYTQSYINIGSGIQKLIGVGEGHRHSGSKMILSAYLYLCQNMESRINIYADLAHFLTSSI
jgi:hypothetical protein